MACRSLSGAELLSGAQIASDRRQDVQRDRRNALTKG